MGRKLKFDVRKCSSLKASGKIGVSANDVEALCKPIPTMANAETQTDNVWFYDSKAVQPELEPVTTVATQTGPDVILQKNQGYLKNQ